MHILYTIELKHDQDSEETAKDDSMEQERSTNCSV